MAPHAVWAQTSATPEDDEGRQTSSPGATRLAPVVVSATRSVETIASIPGSVTVIERPEIEKQATISRSLADMLGKLVPGLGPSSQTNTNSAQTLRGRNVLVLIDGVPQTTTRNVSRDLLTIDPSAVERIEVIRGATAIYGSGASGGVINIITRAPGEGAPRLTTEVGGEVSLSRLSAESLGGHLEQGVSGRTGNITYAFNARGATTGGFFDAEGDRIPPDPSQGDLSDSRKYNLLGKVGAHFEAQRLQLTVNHLNAQQDSNFVSDPAVAALPARSVKARALEGLSLDDQPETRNTVLNLDYSHDDVWGSRLHSQIYYRDYLTRFFPFDGRSLAAWRNIAQTRLESESAGGRLAVETPVSFAGDKDLTVLWGTDYARERTAQPAAIFDPTAFDQSGGRVFRQTDDRIFVPPILHTTLGLFGQLEWVVNPSWTLRAGVRHERIDAEVDEFVTLGGGDRIEGGSVDYSDTLFNAGVVFFPTNNVDLFANFSQGFSLPDIGLGLRGAPAGFSIASAILKPVKVDNYEIGTRVNWRNVQTSLSLFYSESDLGVSSGGFTTTIIRAPERTYGVEATLDAEFLERWRAGGTLTWTEGENDPDLDGDFAPLNGFRIPPLKVTSYVEHDLMATWRVRLQMLYSGKRDRAADAGVAFGGQSIDDYLTFDLISAIDIGPGTLKIGVENIFNEQYHTAFSQLLPGGTNTSFVAARGTVLSAAYAITW